MVHRGAEAGEAPHQEQEERFEDPVERIGGRREEDCLTGSRRDSKIESQLQTVSLPGSIEEEKTAHGGAT